MAVHHAYEKFIDELVSIASHDVTAALIREQGHSERTNDDDLPLDEEEAARKSFLLELTPRNREIVAQMIDEARESAIHDVASFLEYGLSCDNMTISWDGGPVTASPYASMHYDFIARLNGDKWPRVSDMGGTQ